VALAGFDDSQSEVSGLCWGVVAVVFTRCRGLAPASTHVDDHGASGVEKEQPQEREKEVAENL
jgi:hypothetical protein